MCWWDYGYWVIHIARRVPNANPTQAGAGQAAAFLVAQDETGAADVVDRLGSKYVILDDTLQAWQGAGRDRVTGKFPSIARWAGKEPSEFFDICYRQESDGSLRPVMLYYPEYYRSMCVRLYVFGGKEYRPQDATWLVSFGDAPDAVGTASKYIDGILAFDTYEEAEEYLARQSSARWRLAGLSPSQSCVPLEPLDDYELVYPSPSGVGGKAGEDDSRVKIFECVRHAEER
jgi:dolichyl-diphosphooligosaccharide--protein glycosyltransferase